MAGTLWSCAGGLLVRAEFCPAPGRPQSGAGTRGARRTGQRSIAAVEKNDTSPPTPLPSFGHHHRPWITTTCHGPMSGSSTTVVRHRPPSCVIQHDGFSWMTSMIRPSPSCPMDQQYASLANALITYYGRVFSPPSCPIVNHCVSGTTVDTHRSPSFLVSHRAEPPSAQECFCAATGGTHGSDACEDACACEVPWKLTG